MLILGIESSAAAASAALCRDGTIIGEYIQMNGLTHSQTLLPMARNLLNNTQTPLSSLDAVAVAMGPGSFTGVRIGVAAVKGLCWGAELPAIGVSTLEAMSWHGLAAGEGALICCCMDARRSEVYNALFEIRDGRPARLCEDRAISLAALSASLKNFSKGAFLVGDGAELCYNHLRGEDMACRLAPEPIRLQSAWGVCMAASDKTPAPAGELIPVYLRLSQAERERQARL